MSPTAQERDDDLPSQTQRIETGYGKVYVTIAENNGGGPFEIFINMGSSGGFMNAWCNALGIVSSIALRSGADPGELAEALMDIRMDKPGVDNGDNVLSIPDAVGIALKRHVDGKVGESIREKPNEVELP